MTFKNIDGTTKQAFRIGLKGIGLSREQVTRALINESNKQTYEKLVATDVTGGGKFHVLYEEEDDIFINGSYCNSVEYNSENNTLILSLRIRENGIWKDGQIFTIDLNATGNVSIEDPDSVVEGNIPIFKDGYTIKDSGMGISDELTQYVSGYRNGNPILNQEASKKLPTANSVLEYVGIISENLYDRLQGEANTIDD